MICSKNLIASSIEPVNSILVIKLELSGNWQYKKYNSAFKSFFVNDSNLSNKVKLSK